MLTVEQVDAASIALFDEILGNMGSYAEWGQPSYREDALRSISQAFAAHRIAALEEAAGVVDQLNRSGPYHAIGAAAAIRALKGPQG